VVVTPLDKHNNPYVVVSNGIALNRSFTSFFTQNLKLENINFLFTHEGLHRWIPHEFSLNESFEHEMAWFKEGFTNYLTYKIMLDNQIISRTEYDERILEAYKLVNTSNLKGSSNLELAKGFFEMQGSSELLYARGAVIAHIWDLDIQKQTSSEQDIRNFLLLFRNYVKGLQVAEISNQSIFDFADKFGLNDTSSHRSKILKLHSRE
jgi:predicted metalloprotease with PDZ domain